MVADGDVFNVEIGEIGNIISQVYEEEDVIKDTVGNMGDGEGLFVAASVAGTEMKIIYVRLMKK